jgi:hypothetical protein
MLCQAKNNYNFEDTSVITKSETTKQSELPGQITMLCIGLLRCARNDIFSIADLLKQLM